MHRPNRNLRILSTALVVLIIAVFLTIIGWATHQPALYGAAILLGLFALLAPLRWAETVPNDQATRPVRFLKTLRCYLANE
jgi:hypothetical protein